MRKLHILIIFVLLLSSCNSNTETGNKNSIEIDVENASTLKMSDLFQLEDIIYFSDSLIVDHIKKASVVKNFLVLHCSRGLDYLLIKNMQTGEEYTVSNKGEGPEQYLKLNDFIINSENQIELLDGKSGKILSFNLNGDLLSVYQNELLQKAQNFMSLNGDDYFLFGGNFYAGSYDHQLIVFNKNKGEITKKFIPIDHKKAAFMNFIEARNFNKNPAYFSHAYNPYIYKINESTIIDSMFFDFGSYTIPEEDLNKEYADIREFSMSMQKSGNVYGFSNQLLNGDILFASANQSGNSLHFYVDLNSNKAMVFNRIENDLFGVKNNEKIKYHHRPLIIDENYAYYSISLEMQNEILNNDNVLISSQSDLNKELLDRIDNFEEGDNLAIVKLKILN